MIGSARRGFGIVVGWEGMVSVMSMNESDEMNRVLV